MIWQPILRALLPPEVAVVEAFGDRADASLLPPEEEAVARAVEHRRREFATARACAREALTQLGRPAVAIPVGRHREPRWPAGVVGAITHCTDYYAAAVAESSDVRAVGIDAEPHEALPHGVLRVVARPDEVAALGEHGTGVHWDRVLFSAKESVYKAWFPLAGRWLGFHDATVRIDPRGCFSADLHVPGPLVAGGELGELTGRWTVAGGLVVTALHVPPTAPAQRGFSDAEQRRRGRPRHPARRPAAPPR